MGDWYGAWLDRGGRAGHPRNLGELPGQSWRDIAAGKGNSCSVPLSDSCYQQMRITAAVPGKVNFELPIEKQHTNRLGILHGAAIATMVDTSGSLALASRGLYSTGVSTDLSVTYISAGGKIGDIIRGEVTCDKCKYTESIHLAKADGVA